MAGGNGLYEAILYHENLMIPMRDGVKLATDVWRPTVNGKVLEERLPIVLTRTPYDKANPDRVGQAAYFVKHGYVAAIQDCRGRYASEGVFTKYASEPRDGFDTIEALAELPFTNGDIGMWGLSYGAHVQACAAKLAPPHLKTIVVNMGGISDGWTHAIRNHGALELKQLTWAFVQAAAETDSVLLKEMFKKESVADWFSALPLRRGTSPLAFIPSFEAFVLEMMAHGDYDDYWKDLGTNWAEYYGQTSDIPMIHVSGWYDAYCQTAIDNYLGLARMKKSPIRMLMGPWLHGKTTQTHAGDVDFGPESVIRDFYDEFHLRWFDCYLKGKKNGVEREPALRLFIMGTGDGRKDGAGRLSHGGTWRNEEDWPLPGTAFTRYYFHGDGSLRPIPPQAGEKPTLYTFDPDRPTPTIGGSLAASEPVFVGGAFDQREREYRGDPLQGFYGSRPPYLPLRARPDVVVFQTDPLAREMEVTGPIVVKLFASSTATDTDFTVKLVDVYPPSPDFPAGFDMNLTDGILRGRYRNSRTEQELMKPGEIYEFIIEPFPTANVFKKGHRIRIDISSSNFPRFDVNPNTGEPLGTDRRRIRADNTVYHDAVHPSHVILPIIPGRRG
jgi:uncharacterized protein